MRCGKAHLLLDDYLRGTLASAERDAVAEHLVSCGKCSAELEFLKRYREGLASVPPLRAPAGFLAKVREGIARDTAARPPARRGIISRLFLPLTIKLPLEAAGLLATAALVFVLVKPTLDESMRPAPSVSQQEQEVAAEKAPGSPDRRETRPRYHAFSRAKKSAKTERIAQEKTAPVLEIDLAVASATRYRADRAPGAAREEEAPSPEARGQVMDMARSRAMKSESASQPAPRVQREEASRSRAADEETAGGVAPARQATVQFTSTEQIVKIKRMIRPLGGRIIGENSAAGDRPAYVRVELPEANYAKFVDQLNQVGQVTRQPARRAVLNRRSVDVQVNVMERK